MAVDPLFWKNISDIRNALGLSQTVEGSSKFDALESAIRESKTVFFRVLESQQSISTLQGYVDTDNPANDNEHRRSMAKEAEFLLVKSKLLISLPALTLENPGVLQKDWNEEAVGRELSLEERMTLSSQLYQDALNILTILKGSKEITDISKGHVADLVSSTTPIRPGDSLHAGVSIYSDRSKYILQ